MIDTNVFRQLVGEAREALVRFHLNDALFVIETLRKEVENNELNHEYESIQRDYTAMLDFLTRGGNDPQQGAMQEMLVQKTYNLLNAIDILYRQKQSTDFIFQCHQKYISSDYLKRANHEIVETEEDGFLLALELCTLASKEYATLQNSLNHANDKVKNMIVTGLTLSLWGHFDPLKFKLLVEFAPQFPRGIVGVVMCALKYTSDLEIFPEDKTVLRDFCLSNDYFELIHKINKGVFISAKSEEITRKIRSEIIPRMMDGVKDERLRMGFDLDEDDNDAFQKIMKGQLNPEDEKLKKKKKQVLDSAMQIIEMQNEGLDINNDMFMTSINNPFFQYIYNWFKPYDVHDPQIEKITYANGKPNFFLKMYFESSNMCDIDAYAFTLMMDSSSFKSYGSGLLSLMLSSLGEAEGLFGFGDYDIKPKTAEDEINNMIRVFYRLCAKSKWKNTLDNLFDYSFNFLENEFLHASYSNDTQALLNMGNLLFKYGETESAYAYLKKIEELEGASHETLTIMASCLQTQGKYRQAANLLIQADLLNPDDPVILGKLLSCYESLNSLDEHLECLLRLEQVVPDSSKITVETGLSLMKLERYQEASQRFYKLELEEKKIIPSMRAIAWCSLKLKKYDTAMRYYKKIFNTPNAATWEDYLNGGHTAWLMDDVSTALTFYHQYIKRYLKDDPKIVNAMAPFDNDNQELIKNGKSQREIDLMHDLILHNL